MDTENMEKALELFSRYASRVELKTREVISLTLCRDGSGHMESSRHPGEEILDFTSFTDLIAKLSEHIFEEWEKSDY